MIVTDKEIAMMNALKVVFPNSSNLLCHFHINKNVKAKCKLIVYPKEKWDLVMDVSDNLMNSPNEDEYM